MEKGYFRNGVSLFAESIQKRKRTEEKIVKVAIPILGKLCYTKCCLKRELNDKR